MWKYKSLSCLPLWGPVGYTVHGVLRARILEWVAFPSENATAPHSSTPAWKIPWTEEPGGLQSPGSWRVGHDWATSLSLLCTGEGNGKPLQCSCLENPRDRGAWWASVHGVAQSRTRLKQLSSSSLSLLQGIFPTQGLNSGLPRCRQILYQLSHKGSPRILECVAYPFSRGSSRPKNWTGVSDVASGFFTSWATREAHFIDFIIKIQTVK